MPDQPKSILYIRPDTIGDLVIFSAAVRQLIEAWPEARHTLLVRPGYEGLAPLFPAQLRWLVSTINPFTQKPGEARAEFETLQSQIAPSEPDVIVAPTLNRTWLETAIASRFPTARRVSLGHRAVDPLFAHALKLEFEVEASAAFPETVVADETLRDWENNHRLVEQLVGLSLTPRAPTLTLPSAARAEAEEQLRVLGISRGEYIIVFAGGLANVPIKAWPYSKFGDLIAWLQKAQPYPVVVAGHISEAAAIDEVVAQARSSGASEPARWLGRDGQIPLLAAMLEAADFYVGHDTGAMHIAAAVGRPVVGIFGGGHWPRFRPVGANTVSVVQPLPCFGCNWDCIFGDAPCVKGITTSDVQRAVNLVLARSGAGEEVVEVHHFSDEALRLIAAVKTRYVALQTDRLQRQHRIEELKSETDAKDVEIAELKTETDGKDVEIAELKIAAEERKREMEAIKAELEAECAEKDEEIAELKGEADTKDREIDDLKKVCNEREQLIITLDGHIKNFQAMVAQLRDESTAKDHVIEARAQELSAKSQTLAAAEATLAKLPPDADNWAKIFHDKDVHIKNIESMLAARSRQLASAEASIANYAAGYANLEQVKHFNKLLAEKEAVIQSLDRACRERERVIKQLALDSAGPLSRLSKLWYATRQHARLKWWLPLNDWFFERAVEKYWMKIGVLDHYPPRPLKWDQIPKGRLPESKLPKVGVVTPSYGQANFIESTILSVLNQQYPKLHYAVQDGGSKDASPQIIARYADRLQHWESVRDKGQADAIQRGFRHLDNELGSDDVMAWLNSDDLIAPRALRFVAEYFATHPNVDVIYGHRIIIDGNDRDVGRWIMPRHDPKTLEWIDYVPQETLFWRKRIWDRVGGIDPSFQFALDWDLIARFQLAGARIVRVPYFLGCFRVHAEQKTSQHIHTVGSEEMTLIRSRFHGERHNDFETINRFARKARLTGALTARLARLGIRY